MCEMNVKSELIVSILNSDGFLYTIQVIDRKLLTDSMGGWVGAVSCQEIRQLWISVKMAQRKRQVMRLEEFDLANASEATGAQTPSLHYQKFQPDMYLYICPLNFHRIYRHIGPDLMLKLKLVCLCFSQVDSFQGR